MVEGLSETTCIISAGRSRFRDLKSRLMCPVPHHIHGLYVLQSWDKDSHCQIIHGNPAKHSIEGRSDFCVIQFSFQCAGLVCEDLLPLVFACAIRLRDAAWTNFIRNFSSRSMTLEMHEQKIIIRIAARNTKNSDLSPAMK